MFVDFLIERFEQQGDDPAVISPAGRCSFAELAERYRHWRRDLDREGLEPGTVVGLTGDFSPNSIALLLALAEGQAIVALGAGGEGREGAHRARIAQLEAAFHLDRADEARFERTGTRASHELYAELRDRRHPGLVLFSSGTSGEPKAALRDFTHVLDRFRGRREPLATLTFLLFDHAGGVNTLLHTLASGAAVVATDDRSPERICALIERERIELLPATPTFLNLLLLSGAHERYDLGSLRVISYGAEPMPQVVLDRLRAAFPGVRLKQTYGLIETGTLPSRSRDDGSLWIKVGGRGCETRVVDGILQVRSGTTIIGYLNAPTPIVEGGWFVTGDAVLQDGEYVRFLGRESELVNVGGEKVYPAEVEDVIQSMDEVEAVAVHGEPHGLVGEIVCARVKAVPAADPAALPAAVKRHCRERLARYKVPVRVQLVDELPVSERFKKLRR